MSIRTGYSAANLQTITRENEQEIKALQAELTRLQAFNLSLRNALEVSILQVDELTEDNRELRDELASVEGGWHEN